MRERVNYGIVSTIHFLCKVMMFKLGWGLKKFTV